MIEIKNLTKFYGDYVVFKNLNLSIKTGEIIAIIGSSGTGKSTFLRTLNGLDPAQTGEININGFSVNTQTAKKSDYLALRQQTAFVFQNYALFNHLTAKQNIAESLITVKKYSKKQAYQIALDLLQEIGLADKAESYPSSLSGGQQQRVAIGRAMAQNAALMLFDEPTSALDPEWVNEVLQLIKKVAQQRQTMIIVTHEMQFAQDIADRVIFMADGQFVEQGSPAEIFNHPQDTRLQRFLNLVKK